MIRLSVNVNKVATLRNSRGGPAPSVIDAVGVCLSAGAHGITVHPRADSRHITAEDTRAIARLLEGRRPDIEYNIEGDPRPDWLALVHEVRPDQATIVPVTPGEITSHVGWSAVRVPASLQGDIRSLKRAGIRVSLFVEPVAESIELAASLGADRIELYTEPFARAFERGEAAALQSFAGYLDAARVAHAAGLGINAGHDLDLDNLVIFRDLPHLDEVSIGHALMSRALFSGLETSVRAFLAVLHSSAGSPAAGGRA